MVKIVLLILQNEKRTEIQGTELTVRYSGFFGDVCGYLIEIILKKWKMS